jgi:hypothetical protein
LTESNTRPGVLAVWNNRDDGIAELYEDWYINQHFPERVGLPGWQFGRRFEAVDAATPFFTYYRLSKTSAAFSDAYLARLNAPTPETVTVMRNWTDMTRTCCDITLERGETSGALAVVARFYTTPDMRALTSVAESLWMSVQRADGLRRACPLYVQLWQMAETDAPQTNERDVRSEPDREVWATLVVDVMREREAQQIRAVLSDVFIRAELAPDHIDIYRLLGERRS